MTEKMSAPRDIALASSSSYRKALLGKLGIAFHSAAPEIDESPKPGEAPDTLAERLAMEKALALVVPFPNHLIVGSDQVAVIDDRRLGKPGSRANAIDQLRFCAGRGVAFYTALCVLDARTGAAKTDLDITVVHFRPLTESQIQNYVDREQPLDCAGSFKSEGLGIALFDRIEGEDPNALVGLPLIRLVRMLEAFGIEVL